MPENAYQILYIVVLIILTIASFVAMIRSIVGKTIIHRFVGINMLTTIVAIAICIMTLFLKESYLADVAIIYVLLSCLAVLLLCKIYINLFYKEKSEKEAKSDDN